MGHSQLVLTMTEVVGILSVLPSLLQLAHSWPCKQGSVMFRGQCETIYSVHCPPSQRLFRTLKDEEAFCDCDVFGGWYRRAEGECFQNMAPAGDLCHEENKIINVTLLSAHNIIGLSNISITDLLNITELSGLNITGLLGLNITDLSTLNFTDPADLYVLNVTSLNATYKQTFECIDKENYDYAGSSVKDPDYFPRDVL